MRKRGLASFTTCGDDNSSHFVDKQPLWLHIRNVSVFAKRSVLLVAEHSSSRLTISRVTVFIRRTRYTWATCYLNDKILSECRNLHERHDALLTSHPMHPTFISMFRNTYVSPFTRENAEFAPEMLEKHCLGFRFTHTETYDSLKFQDWILWFRHKTCSKIEFFALAPSALAHAV